MHSIKKGDRTSVSRNSERQAEKKRRLEGSTIHLTRTHNNNNNKQLHTYIVIHNLEPREGYTRIQVICIPTYIHTYIQAQTLPHAHGWDNQTVNRRTRLREERTPDQLISAGRLSAFAFGLQSSKTVMFDSE